MSDQIILSVPAKLDYLQTVESFVEIIVKHFKTGNYEKLTQMLRSTVNEAFVNVLRHTPQPKSGLVSIFFDLHPPTLSIKFPDSGKGLKINNTYPPYPTHLVGSDHLFLKTIDGELYAHVESPFSVRLWFKDTGISPNRDDLIEQFKPGGMGLSIIVKFMDEVRFKLDLEQGHCLEVKKRLPD